MVSHSGSGKDVALVIIWPELVLGINIASISLVSLLHVLLNLNDSLFLRLIALDQNKDSNGDEDDDNDERDDQQSA